MELKELEGLVKDGVKGGGPGYRTWRCQPQEGGRDVCLTGPQGFGSEEQWEGSGKHLGRGTFGRPGGEEGGSQWERRQKGAGAAWVQGGGERWGLGVTSTRVSCTSVLLPTWYLCPLPPELSFCMSLGLSVSARGDPPPPWLDSSLPETCSHHLSGVGAL